LTTIIDLSNQLICSLFQFNIDLFSEVCLLLSTTFELVKVSDCFINKNHCRRLS
jgi:hypothetical protein